MKKIVLMGAGGHAGVVLEALLSARVYTVVGVTVSSPTPSGSFRGIPVLGSDEVLSKIYRQGVRLCFLAVGGESPSARVRLAQRAEKIGFSFVNIIHPNAVISSTATLATGVYVAPGSVINAGAQIGRHSIINTNACVEHDCILGKFVHVAPGVTLSGGVHVGDETHLGTGCSVSHGVRIGAGAVIGVGSAVVSDIPARVVAFGNPCRKIRVNPLAKGGKS